MFRLIVAN